MVRKRHVYVFEDLESMSRAAAQRLVITIEETIRERGRFALALPGGSTPRTLYRILAEEYQDKIPWAHVHLFWGDERYVPADHPESNYHLVNESLISKVPLPPANIHVVPVESDSPENAADRYEKILKRFFKPGRRHHVPSFDLVLLGVGTDGHTASLFAESPALQEKNRWAVPVSAPEKIFPRERITITLPMINESRFVFFLVSGADKKRIVQLILNEPETARERLPAARVSPRRAVFWYLDKDAAGTLYTDNARD